MTTSYRRGNKYSPAAFAKVKSEKVTCYFSSITDSQWYLLVGKDSFSSYESSDDKLSSQHQRQDADFIIILN